MVTRESALHDDIPRSAAKAVHVQYYRMAAGHVRHIKERKYRAVTSCGVTLECQATYCLYSTVLREP